MGEGRDLLQPLGGLLALARVELTQLPGVGHPADAVTQDEQTHNGQADLGLAHLREKEASKLTFNYPLLLTSLPLLLKLILSPTMLLML